MKALSIKEPWASLIIEGKKTIELRSWTTRHRGTILIHRSGKAGGIVGVVEIEEIIPINSIGQYQALRDQHHAPNKFYQEKLFGWVLKHAKPIEFIPCKGKLGLWQPDEELLKKIEMSLGTAKNG